MLNVSEWIDEKFILLEMEEVFIHVYFFVH